LALASTPNSQFIKGYNKVTPATALLTATLHQEAHSAATTWARFLLQQS